MRGESVSLRARPPSFGGHGKIIITTTTLLLLHRRVVFRRSVCIYIYIYIYIYYNKYYLAGLYTGKYHPQRDYTHIMSV
jgi:hypothetical protein